MGVTLSGLYLGGTGLDTQDSQPTTDGYFHSLGEVAATLLEANDFPIFA